MVKCQDARGPSWSDPKRAAGLMKCRLHKSQYELLAGGASSWMPRLGVLAFPVGPATLFKTIALVSPQAAPGTPSATAMSGDGTRAPTTCRASPTLRRAAFGGEEEVVEEDEEVEEEEKEKSFSILARSPPSDVGSSFLMTRSPASASF